MTRILLCLACAVLAVLPHPAAAQQKAAPPAISAEQARIALDVLNDPAKRAAFAATLSAIVKAQPAAAPNGAAPNAGAPNAGAKGQPQPADTAKPAADPATDTLPIPLAPDSLGAQVLVGASAFMSHLGTQAMEAFDTVQSLPLLWGWAVVMVTNPVARDLLADVAWRVALALTAGLAAERGLRYLMRRPMRKLEGIAPAKAQAWAALRRAPVVLARLGLQLVPVLGILVTGHLIAGSALGGQGNGQVASRLIILAVTDAYALSAALLAVARMVLVPGLLHVQEETAAYLMTWTRRLVLVAVIGYAVGEAWLLLGLSAVAHDALQKAVGLVLFVCLGYIVLRNRDAVRERLSAPPGHFGPAATWRNRIAAGWHAAALFCIASLWIVWAIELPVGYAATVRYVLLTGALLFGTRLVLRMVTTGLDRLLRPEGTDARFSAQVDARLQFYLPLLSGSLRLATYLLAMLALLQLYGLDAITWLLTSPLGLRILSSAGSLAMTVALSIAVWEGVNTAVQRHLDKLHREAQLAKSARLRTLLPLLRTTLMVTLAIVAGLMVLSEIGINIAPLLAGAGILGVAIGFGSQKLVQDLITGIFLLLENAMQVGDWVTVSGLSGTVEALSVRTIRLRAVDGSVHIIPFSAVTSVTNVNRGLGNASVNVTVDYSEDTDRVSAELKAIVSDMRDDPELAGKMLSDLQLWGVDKFDGASVTIAGQVVCTDSGRWAVQREFNRRMKQRFQELGIRVFNPLHTIALPAAAYDMEDRSG